MAPSASIFTGYSATEDNFMKEAPKSYVIHLASHAFIDSTYDVFSGLVLSTSSDSSDDGFLMGYEISDLHLFSDLVTLSACETGRGRLTLGEGVLGLPRLFMRSGASSVLMSYWKVEDRFTSNFMSDFYGYYLVDNFTKSKAVAEAKRNVMTASKNTNGRYHQHPLFWASFVLYGQPGKEGNSYGLFVALSILSLICLVFCGIKIKKLRKHPVK
jgi:CHAT domain-containing protein